MEEIRERLDLALSRIDRPGSFCTSGRAPAVLPGLEVEGLGPIGLPLTAKQARELKRYCERAPYGKGEQTVVDTRVRRAWRMGPDRFALTNPEWGRFLAETVRQVQVELGLEGQRLESHLYDLLLYEPGSFFLPHRDGEKRDRMVATLVVVLPSQYEGGELVVRHDGQERTIDFGGAGGDPFHLHFAAFYADCEHEIRPLRAGHRLCLVYNLTLARSRKPIAAPRDSEHIEAIVPLLREWAEGDGSAGKLVITLEHQYTQDGLAWDALKGVDRARARILREAARRAGCVAVLGLLTFWEMGSPEEDYGEYGYGYGDRYGRRRRYEEEDEDEDEEGGRYTMEEVFETRLSVDHLSDSEGQALPIGPLDVDEGDLLDPESLRDVAPEEQYEGYTGNEGMTLERWYRHAAILLWPERRHFEVLCERDSRSVVPVLRRMVSQWRRDGGKDAAQKSHCIELAGTILAQWPEQRHAWAFPQQPETGALLDALDALGEPSLIATFLGEVPVRDASVDPSPSLAATCRKYGWGTFREALLSVMRGTTAETMERNVRLLEHLCSDKSRKKQGWAELCASLSQELLAAIEAIDRKPAPPSWSAPEVDRAEVLAGLVRSLILTGQPELLSRLVDHALATPRKYPLTGAHVPALANLRPWLRRHLKEPSPALSRWVAACRGQLEALTAREPREPTDFRRPAAITCSCADCTELKQFLADPREAVHRFRVKQERRNHLAEMVRKHRCDLDLTTERVGSPHTLVCTKNTASYRERLATYHQNQEHLATVRAIEAGLPH